MNECNVAFPTKSIISLVKKTCWTDMSKILGENTVNTCVLLYYDVYVCVHTCMYS